MTGHLVSIVLLVLLLLILFITELMTGSVRLTPVQVFSTLAGQESPGTIWRSILFDFRLPKAVTAVAAGAALAVSGLQMQTLFRNPLAGPDVLGISSGASLGVAIVMLGFGRVFTTGDPGYLSGWMQIMAAWTGAAAVLVLIMALSLRVRDVMTILILGILFGSAVSAVISILQYFSQQSALKSYVIWSMGSLGSLSRSHLRVMLMSLAAGFVLCSLTVKRLNVLLLGETYARSMGLNLRSSRMLVFLSTSILTGSVTAFCGPIGFVGIAVPHLARMFFRSPDHRLLIPGSLLIGAILLMASDLLSQLPPEGILLPVNAVTALTGIPVVIWVILKNRQFEATN